MKFTLSEAMTMEISKIMQNHVGFEHAISTGNFCKMFNVNPGDIFHHVGALLDAGVPVAYITDPKGKEGIFLLKDRGEMLQALEQVDRMWIKANNDYNEARRKLHALETLGSPDPHAVAEWEERKLAAVRSRRYWKAKRSKLESIMHTWPRYACSAD